MELSIKNMVCDRCISTVKRILQKHGVDYIGVELGKVSLDGAIPVEVRKRVEEDLEKEGMPFVRSRGEQLLSELKQLIQMKAVSDKEPEVLLSKFLEDQIGVPYRKLNIIFTELERKTINQYFIELKIERAKELISYNFHSISEISYLLNYSSPQHLSRQFKKITGMTPSEFKKRGGREKYDKI